MRGFANVLPLRSRLPELTSVPIQVATIEGPRFVVPSAGKCSQNSRYRRVAGFPLLWSSRHVTCVVAAFWGF